MLKLLKPMIYSNSTENVFLTLLIIYFQLLAIVAANLYEHFICLTKYKVNTEFKE